MTMKKAMVVLAVLKVMAIFVVLCLPIDAWAGRLHIRWVTLGDIARNGLAVLGTVVSVCASTRIVEVRVKKIWRRKENEDLPTGIVETEDRVQKFRIYGGVVWKDPNKSPVDRRVRGKLALSEIKPGQDVIVVSNMGYEVLPADSKNLQKLDLFFSDQALEHYKQSSPADVLYADLNDPDLWKPALEAMGARLLLEPRAFLALEPHKISALGWILGAQLPAKEFDAWLASMIPAIEDAPRRLELVTLARDSSLADKVSLQTQLALIKTLDLADPDQQNVLSWYVRDEATAVAEVPDSERAKHAVDFALQLAAVRSRSGDWEDFKALQKLNDSLPASDIVEINKRIGALVITSRLARDAKDRIDDGLFEFFLEQVKRAPSPHYLPELAGIDLSFIPKTHQWQVESRVAVLGAGLAIARADPGSAPAVYTALERWVRDERIFDPEIVMSIDAEKPGAKQKRWATTLRQFKELKAR